MSSRVEAVDRIILAAARPVDGFYLGVMKHALLHVKSSAWAPDEVVDGVVTIFAPEPVKKNGLSISLAVMIGILEEDKVGFLGEVDPVLAKFESERKVKIVRKDSPLVGFSILIRVFENEDLVIGLDAGKSMRVGGHGGDPETSRGIKVEGDWIAKFRKFLLRSEELDCEALSDLELGSFCCGSEGGGGAAPLTRKSDGNLDGGRVIDLGRKVFATGGTPDPLIPKAAHLKKFFALERKVDRSVWVFAIAVNVEAIHGTIPIKEGIVFFQYLGPNCVQRSPIR